MGEPRTGDGGAPDGVLVAMGVSWLDIIALEYVELPAVGREVKRYVCDDDYIKHRERGV